MATLNPYGSAGQLIQSTGFQPGESGIFSTIGGQNIYSGAGEYGSPYEGQYGFYTMDPTTGRMGQFDTDVNSLLNQLGLSGGHQGFQFQGTLNDGGDFQSTSPFFQGDNYALAQKYFGGAGGPVIQAGAAQLGSDFHNPNLVAYDPTYGYLTPQENRNQGSGGFFKKNAGMLAVLAAPFAVHGLQSAGLLGGAGSAGAAGGAFGASPAGFGALPTSLGIDAAIGSAIPTYGAGTGLGVTGAGLGSASSLLGASPLAGALAPGAGMITPATIGIGNAALGPTLEAAAGAGTGAASAAPSLGLDALTQSWGVNAIDPYTAALGIGPSPATLNPSIASLSQSAPYASSSAQLAAGAGIPVAGPAGSVYNSLPGLFSSLFDDPKELLKLLGSGALSFIGGNQQEKIAGQAAQQADPYQAFRPGDAAQYQQVQNATNFDNPIYNAMRDQMERATIRRGAQSGNLGSANLVNELMTRNAALFNDYRGQELQRLGLTSGAFRDPSAAAQILGGGKAAGLATKYGGLTDALSDFLTPNDPYRDLIMTMMRGY